MPLVQWDLQPWSIQNAQFTVTVDPSQISGLRGILGASLQIPFKVDFPEGGSYARDPLLLTLGGWLTWPGDGQFGAGILIPHQPFHPNDQVLRIPIRDDQVAALETARGGGALQVLMVLTGWATVLQQHQLGPLVPTPRAIRASGDAGRFVPIDREHWLKIFSDLGGEKIRLLELPEVILTGQPQWGEAIRLLDQASSKLRRNEFEGVIGECRKVTEGIVTILAEHWGVPRTKDKSFDGWTKEIGGRMRNAWPNDEDAANQLVSLLSAAWTWTSPSHHFGSPVPLKREASFAFNLVASLLDFSAQVMEAHPQPLKGKQQSNGQEPQKTARGSGVEPTATSEHEA